MVKSRVTTKAKVKGNFVKIDIDIDDETREALNGIADLAKVTIDQVVSVYLATQIWNDENTQIKRSAWDWVNETNHTGSHTDWSNRLCIIQLQLKAMSLLHWRP